jgi:hypothetical protein
MRRSRVTVAGACLVSPLAACGGSADPAVQESEGNRLALANPLTAGARDADRHWHRGDGSQQIRQRSCGAGNPRIPTSAGDGKKAGRPGLTG